MTSECIVGGYPWIKLTRREHSLLLMDIVEVGTTAATAPIARQLAQGSLLQVTPIVIGELREFIDRDADTVERAAYLRLLRKCRVAIVAAQEAKVT